MGLGRALQGLMREPFCFALVRPQEENSGEKI
jgi:hypothetical protein